MKKLLVGLMLMVGVLTFSPVITHAATIADLQAMIAQLTAQLNLMLQQQNNTATSTGYISMTEKPVLALSKSSSGDESSLVASSNVSITAGNQDILIAYFRLLITDSNGKGVYTNVRQEGFKGIKNTSMETVSGLYNTSYKVWRVKANTTATFNVTVTENPQMMFAGVYKASFAIAEVGIFKDGEGRQVSMAAKDLPSSNSVTIVGEKSPYISKATFSPIIAAAASGALNIEGVRLNITQTATVKCGNDQLITKPFNVSPDAKSSTFAFMNSAPMGSS